MHSVRKGGGNPSGRDGIETLFRQGAAALSRGERALALDCFDRILTIDPRHAIALNNRGIVLAMLGRHAEALPCFERALAVDAQFLDAINNLGLTLANLQRLEEALRCFDRLLALAPTHASALLNKGLVAGGLGNQELALSCCERVLAMNPNHAVALHNSARALRLLQRYAEALARCDRALRIKPDDTEALNIRAMILERQCRHDEALVDLDRLLLLAPEHIDALNNRAISLQGLGRDEEALACLERVLALDPRHSEALSGHALALLARGDLREGFRGYEHRWKTVSAMHYQPPTSAPLWLGESDLSGKTILLYAEQGFGDTLQFVRYAPLVAQRGGRVILRVPAALQTLMQTLPGVMQVIDETEPLPPHALQCPLMSLPLAFGTTLETIPAETPYLRPDPARVTEWRARLGARTKPRIGIVWSGSTLNPITRIRDVPLAVLCPLLALDAQFINLQKDLTDQDRALLAELPQLQRHGESLRDFADTAALIANLDLVITVDTSVAHLAGALAKPTWILNRHAGCWRWLRNRSDSPWYPTVRLFRQKTRDDWAGVIEDVRAAAAQFVELPAPQPGNPAPPAQDVDTLMRAGAEALRWRRYATALSHFSQALLLRPHHADAACGRAVVLRQLERHAEALACFDEALRNSPDHIGLLAGRGATLRKLSRPGEALVSLDRALALKPDDADSLANRGVAMGMLGRHEEALACFDQALRIDPDHVDALLNRGVAASRFGHTHEALACCDRALRINPCHAFALYNRSFLHLKLGKLPEGFIGQERRWDTVLFRHARPETRAPYWLGEVPLKGKTILLFCEQGLGDAIQFARFAPMLSAQGAIVILRVPKALHALMETLPGVQRVITDDAALPPHDFHCSLMSLPLALGTTLETIPAETPYLRAAPARMAEWSVKLGARIKPRIGIAWAGRQYGAVNPERDVGLRHLRRLLTLDAQFISLQKEIPEQDGVELAKLPQLQRHGESLQDFADTAALIANLDLVIAVDSSVAHLAGALNKPTWILDRHVSCWRWLRNRSDSPWYPTVRLFRQKTRDDWAGVIEDVRVAAAQFVKQPQLQSDNPAPPAQDIPTLMRGGIDAFCAGSFEQARQCFAAILELKPDHIGALNNQALVLGNLNRGEEALACLDRALAIQPAQVEVLSNRGFRLNNLGRHQEAVDSCDQALALQPDHVEALNNRGLGARGLQRHEEALQFFSKALLLNPQHLDALNNQGNTLALLERHAEALACFDRALALKPDYLAAWINRGNVLQSMLLFEEALDCMDKALKIDPLHLQALTIRSLLLGQLKRHEEALACHESLLRQMPNDLVTLNNKGNTLQVLGQYSAALECFDRALLIDPRHVDVLVNRANVLDALDRPEEVLESCEKALAIDPAQVDALNNKALALRKLNRYDDSMRCLERALQLKPDHVSALMNLGLAHDHLNHPEQALHYMDQALAIAPDSDEAICARGALYLSLGRLPEGFRALEKRWSTALLRGTWLDSAPQWQGDAPLHGKTILLYSEQGFGDVIQCVRYAPLVARRGGRVILQVAPALQALMKSLPGIDRIVTSRLQLPKHDFNCPLMSLPLAFGTTLETIPADRPYLKADPAQVAHWRARLGPRTKPRIGIVWAGNPKNPITRARDIPLEMLRPLLRLDAEYISLQKEVTAADSLALAADPGMARLGESLADFADTAALIANLDLVISVDSSVAHLSGALGKPTWILNRLSACWRWLKQRSDSPWYPSARLFRQQEAGDWTGVIAEVGTALSGFLEDRARHAGGGLEIECGAHLQRSSDPATTLASIM